MRGYPTHAIDVPPVGGMFATPATTTTWSTDTAHGVSPAHTATTDSKGYSTVASYSPGDIPFGTTPEPFLSALELEQMASECNHQQGTI